jgi:hypothetical protein
VLSGCRVDFCRTRGLGRRLRSGAGALGLESRGLDLGAGVGLAPRAPSLRVLGRSDVGALGAVTAVVRLPRSSEAPTGWRGATDSAFLAWTSAVWLSAFGADSRHPLRLHRLVLHVGLLGRGGWVRSRALVLVTRLAFGASNGRRYLRALLRTSGLADSVLDVWAIGGTSAFTRRAQGGEFVRSRRLASVSRAQVVRQDGGRLGAFGALA